MKLSVIVPVYNEADVIENVLANLKKELAVLNLEAYEIMVVNDCSTDATLEKISRITEIKIINQPYNKGNGAALKIGARQAQFDWILTFDADGQHRPEDIGKLLKYTDNFDLISGERNGYQGPWARQPGKKLIHWLARYLLKAKIKDFNCGLRLIKKEPFLRFVHLYPDGFSCSTTTIFAFLKEKLNIKFVPIEIMPRQGGKSMVGPKEAVTYFMLIVRLIMLFSPLRIFFPASVILFLIGLVLFIYDLTLSNLSDSTVLVLVASLIIFFFGLMADQLAAVRRELNK